MQATVTRHHPSPPSVGTERRVDRGNPNELQTRSTCSPRPLGSSSLYHRCALRKANLLVSCDSQFHTCLTAQRTRQAALPGVKAERQRRRNGENRERPRQRQILCSGINAPQTISILTHCGDHTSQLKPCKEVKIQTQAHHKHKTFHTKGV